MEKLPDIRAVQVQQQDGERPRCVNTCMERGLRIIDLAEGAWALDTPVT